MAGTEFARVQTVRGTSVEQVVAVIAGEQDVNMRRDAEVATDNRTFKQQYWDAGPYERWPSETSASEELSVEERKQEQAHRRSCMYQEPRGSGSSGGKDEEETEDRPEPDFSPLELANGRSR